MPSATTSDRAAGVKLALCGYVRSIGKFWARKYSKFFPFAIDSDARSPSGIMRVPVNAHVCKLGVSGGRSAVLTVDVAVCFPEVAKPIVRAIPVYVINHLGRPLPCRVQPSKSMSSIVDFVNADGDISLIVEASSPLSSVSASFRQSPQPNKFPRVWIVVNNFAQSLCGKIGSSHDAVLSLIGQRLGSVSALVGLRYFKA